MVGPVEIALAVALLVVGLLLVLVVRGRSSAASAPRSSAAEPPVLPVAEQHSAATSLQEKARAQSDALLAQTQAVAQRERKELLDSARQEADRERAVLLDTARLLAERERAEATRTASEHADREAERLVEALRSQSADLQRRDQRLSEREERLDADERRLSHRDEDIAAAEQAVAAAREALAAKARDHAAELERIAGLTASEAKTELLDTLQTQVRRESALLIRDLEAEAREQGEQRARNIVVEAIQRIASEQTSESVVSVLHLPSDEMKGRIIGREGRNIRTYETVTGVNLIIDDTPEAVLLSCFDPVRREVGRLTLEKLVADGRIHPHRIEEVHERSKAEVEALCQRAGEDAVLEVGIGDVHPELVTLLGRLRYRTSYGQNVLKHLIETAHIAGIMAAELQMDPRRLKRAAFLHDIGKALTHEVEGSHAIIGADLARRYGEDEEVVHAIEAHHNEVAPETVEAVLTQASDSCSGGRPGARRESLESYVKRLERIEEIASQRPGVDKVYAMQAGREIRVMVAPDQVDDIGAHLLAREVAKQIEDELTYPGQIRVTVVRESRATEIAH